MNQPLAVVTGGNTGIGKATAVTLAKAGFRLAILYAEDPFGAEALAANVGGMAIEVDLREEASVRAAVESIHKDLGRVQILVNNAGIQERVPFLEMTVEQFDRMMTVNTRGPFLMTRAIVPDMVAEKYGKIINIASQTALLGRAEMVHYTASKGALIAMTKSLARELAPHGILVNCVAPGPVISGPALSSPSERDTYMSTIPLKRFARPEEVADTIRFLALEGDYFTGQVLSPNGGEVM